MFYSVDFDGGEAVIRVRADREIAERRAKELVAAADIDPRETAHSAALAIQDAASPRLPSISGASLTDLANWFLAVRLATAELESQPRPPVLVGANALN